MNAAAKTRNISYSQMIYKLRTAHISLNRKMLAQIAVLDKKSFDIVVNVVNT
jgi:large subunit ribosomal protein L20